MSPSSPWRLVAVAMALVTATALVTAVVAWTTSEYEWRVEGPKVDTTRAAAVRMAAVAPQATAMAVPPRSAIAACHRQASRQRAEDAQAEPLKAGLIGAGSLPGTLYGLDADQKRDERYRDAYARCMRSRGHSG
jgi:biotin carboxyl carrier protein